MLSPARRARRDAERPHAVWWRVGVIVCALAAIGLGLGWGVGAVAVKLFQLLHLDEFAQEFSVGSD